jgi:cell division protein FtsA
VDIGTNYIRVAVGDLNDDGTVEILGVARGISMGVRKGQLVDLEMTVQAVQQTVSEAAHMAGEEIDQAVISISGNHIKGVNSRGIIAIKNREISSRDVSRVKEAASHISIPPEREVIDTLPQEFTLDGQDGILDPHGMVGSRLEVDVHIVTAQLTAARNHYKLCNLAGLGVERLYLSSLASSRAVLHPDERDLGVAIVDIGGGTTDVAVWCRGAVRHTAVLAVGGNQISNDIAVGLRTPLATAEKAKIRHGAALPVLADPEEELEIEPIGGGAPRRLSRKVLVDIIHPRVEEILNLVRLEIEKMGFIESIPAGIVLTGGTALLPGIVDATEQVFSLPARIGKPERVTGLIDTVSTPMMATVIGLVRSGLEQGGDGASRSGRALSAGDGGMSRARRMLKNLFS